MLAAHFLTLREYVPLQGCGRVLRFRQGAEHFQGLQRDQLPEYVVRIPQDDEAQLCEQLSQYSPSGSAHYLRQSDLREEQENGLRNGEVGAGALPDLPLR